MARLMRCHRAKSANTRAGDCGRREPVGACEIEPGIFFAPSACESSVWNFTLVVEARDIERDFVPVVKSLRSGNGDRSTSSVTLRRFRIVLKNLEDSAWWIGHRAVRACFSGYSKRDESKHSNRVPKGSRYETRSRSVDAGRGTEACDANDRVGRASREKSCHMALKMLRPRFGASLRLHVARGAGFEQIAR